MNYKLDNLTNNPHRPYSRFEIDRVFNQVKATMHQAAIIRGNGNALYKDCYTGKILNGGELYDYEHIYGSEWVFTTYKHLLTDGQIAQVVNCPENVGVTLRRINQSKGKINPELWLAQSIHIQNNQIDLVWAMGNVQKAKSRIDQLVKKFSSM
jgi:hypothetical protein